MKLHIFEMIEKNHDGRPKILALPENKINTIKTIAGSHACYLVVNGIEVKGSFEDLVKNLDNRRVGTYLNSWLERNEVLEII